MCFDKQRDLKILSLEKMAKDSGQRELFNCYIMFLGKLFTGN